MKNKPLALQIWMVFATITAGIAIVLALLILLTLRIFFTAEIFQTIEDVQKTIWSNEIVQQESPLEMIQFQQNQRMVNHTVLFHEGHVLPGNQLPRPLSQQIYRQALKQEEASQRYTLEINDERLLYVIHKGLIGFKPAYLVSYMYDTYRNDLVATLFKRIISVLGLVLLLSWVPSILLARYLSRPLVEMESHVKLIANRDWKTPVQVDRQDEIGQLAQSIEKMREQLVKQDEAQQSMLQHVSHELKTPVMVIRSYSQAIQDGILPKGNLHDTVEVIQHESSRLEQLIQNLLYLTKLDYLATHELVQTRIELLPFIQAVIDRLKWQRPELEWIVDLEACVIKGDAEQWNVAFENLLDNQIRYAATRIYAKAFLSNETGQIHIEIGNDGEQIDEGTIENLFQTFRKGKSGKFGLGLAIVQRIVHLHQATIKVENKKQGVCFTIRIPKPEDSQQKSTL